MVFKIRDERPIEARQTGMFGHKKAYSNDETTLRNNDPNGTSEMHEAPNADPVNNV